MNLFIKSLNYFNIMNTWQISSVPGKQHNFFNIHPNFIFLGILKTLLSNKIRISFTSQSPLRIFYVNITSLFSSLPFNNSYSPSSYYVGKALS